MTVAFPGRFNLTAIKIGTTHVELTWNGFIPEVYHYEYSVMYSTKFDKDLQNWDRHEVNQRLVMKGLKSNILTGLKSYIMTGLKSPYIGKHVPLNPTFT